MRLARTQPWRRGIGTRLALALLAGAAPLGAAVTDGNVLVYLDNGLPQGDGAWAQLELEIPVRNGRWAQTGWGHATWINNETLVLE